MDNDLPFVDEYHLQTSASLPAAWTSLIEQFGRARGGGSSVFWRLLDAHPAATAGGPFQEGYAWPGFAVTTIREQQYLELTGRHRFSQYRLVMALVPRPHGTSLNARTYASFPGLLGAFYRLLVIGTGAHRLAVTRMLSDVRRRAEATDTGR